MKFRAAKRKFFRLSRTAAAGALTADSQLKVLLQPVPVFKPLLHDIALRLTPAVSDGVFRQAVLETVRDPGRVADRTHPEHDEMISRPKHRAMSLKLGIVSQLPMCAKIPPWPSGVLNQSSYR